MECSYKNQDGNVELLNSIYQNAKMGSQNIAQLLPKIDDQKFQSTLMSQLSQYQNIANQAGKMLNDLNVSPKECIMDKLNSKAGITFNTLTNTSTSHIAEMMITGTTMGVIDLTKKINHNADCQQDVTTLCDDLIRLEEQNTEKLKQFL